jgi:hypothetical protein
VIDMAERMFKFENKYHNTAAASSLPAAAPPVAAVTSLPANTVMGSQPTFIPTNGIRVDAVRYWNIST